MTELVLFWAGFKKELSMYGMGDIGRVAALLCTMVRFGAVTESLGAFLRLCVHIVLCICS